MPGRHCGNVATCLSRPLTCLLTALVRCYQVALSPLMGGACRFEPSCSNYMIEALNVHGPAKGVVLGLWRILRCHPFGAHGYDPVPPKGRWKVEGLASPEKRKGESA